MRNEAKIHYLKNGASVIVTSNHGFKFSDGTESEPQNPEIVKALTLNRVVTPVKDHRTGENLTLKGMPVMMSRFDFDEEGWDLLTHFSQNYDIVLVPYMVISALKDNDVREEYPNVVAFNATPETQRSRPQDKIVDINNWAW